MYIEDSMITDKLLTIDVETTIRNRVGNHTGSAFCPDNKIVWYGEKRSEDSSVAISGPAQAPNYSGRMLVGHNIKFDLHHLRKYDSRWWDYAVNNGIWDTSVAEYLLSAMVEKFPSLDYCADKYGGTLKDNRLAEDYWDKGIDTTEIPEDIILPYLEQDVLNTELVAKAQIAEAERIGMMPLMKAMMQSCLATCEMEWNGLHVDRDRLVAIQATLGAERRSLLTKLEDIVVEACPGMPRDSILLSSPKQMSAFVFGGEVAYTTEEQIGFFKTGLKKGEPKYKNVTYTTQCNVCKKKPEDKWLNKMGYYSTSEDILQLLNDNPFVEGVLRLRWLDKQLGTYCEGMQKLIQEDGLVHHNLNCTATSTGRLSGSNPNLQNIPSQGESEIKGYFTSRFGKHGRIISADYSQLEVVWLAWAAGDENMKNDIRNGVDFHCKRLALKLNEPYEEILHKCKVEQDERYLEMRKKIKTFSFQRSYGAGPQAIAAATGMAIDEIKEIINNEEKAYPELAKFYQAVQSEVERSSTATKVVKVEDGIELRRGFYTAPTGRRYNFMQSVYKRYNHATKRREAAASFSPTIIKNYPIQGGATGDLVPFIIAILMHKVKLYSDKGQAYLINQVHDSIMLDVHIDVLEEVCRLTKETMEKAPYYFNKQFALDFDLPLVVDLESGLNWKEQTEYKLTEKEELKMVQGMVEAVTKEPRQDKYDGNLYNGVKIGKSWFNFTPSNTPAKGQVIEFVASETGNKVTDFTVIDGSATPTQTAGAIKKAPLSAGQLGMIHGMYTNKIVDLLIAGRVSSPEEGVEFVKGIRDTVEQLVVA